MNFLPWTISSTCHDSVVHVVKKGTRLPWFPFLQPYHFLVSDELLGSSQWENISITSRNAYRIPSHSIQPFMTQLNHRRSMQLCTRSAVTKPENSSSCTRFIAGLTKMVSNVVEKHIGKWPKISGFTRYWWALDIICPRVEITSKLWSIQSI